jgi:cell division protein FtsN
MRLQTLVVVALCGLAGCGGKDDQLDREQLVPQGMRRTTVTAHDARTTPAPAATPAPRPAPPAPADSASIAEDEPLVAPAPDDSSSAADVALVDDEVLADDTAPPIAAPAAAAQSPTGRFVVQAGAYKQRATAEGVAGKVQALGVTTRLETVETGSGTLHRVLVPGLADRAAADTLVARLKQDLGIDAAVRKP